MVVDAGSETRPNATKVEVKDLTISYGQKTAALPEAKAHDGEIILAMSHGKKAECAANPCAAAEKAKEAANPCAAVDKATDEAKDAMKSATPCKPKTQ